MAKSSSLQLDLFTKGKDSTDLPIFQRRRSFRDIQGVIAKMNPEVVKSLIGNGGTSPAPLGDPKLRAPMTIFYNGMVSVFDVSPHKAQDILKVAEVESGHNSELSSCSERNLLESLGGDLPISRRNSLQRFLEKRKERLIRVSPYNNSMAVGDGKKN